MNITLDRFQRTDQSTISRVFVNDDQTPICYALEDMVRPEKIFGETAIPAGTYPVTVTYSPHFGRDLPLLVGVPGYEGVRIHPGNTAADTEGCILPGTTFSDDAVQNSRAAFALLFNKILAANEAGESITITVA
jgi:hypothetical protein